MSFGPVVGFGRSQSFMLSADLKKVKSKKKKKVRSQNSGFYRRGSGPLKVFSGFWLFISLNSDFNLSIQRKSIRILRREVRLTVRWASSSSAGLILSSEDEVTTKLKHSGRSSQLQRKTLQLWDLTVILDKTALSPVMNFGCAAERRNVWKETLEREENIVGRDNEPTMGAKSRVWQSNNQTTWNIVIHQCVCVD